MKFATILLLLAVTSSTLAIPAPVRPLTCAAAKREFKLQNEERVKRCNHFITHIHKRLGGAARAACADARELEDATEAIQKQLCGS
ncbi:hypothetical protein ABW20_dc0102421 [Dactylellina cionopaga]|nr:hypothetical protein ABW20_dc0102421 [Dactylellina cionopaga]